MTTASYTRNSTILTDVTVRQLLQGHAIRPLPIDRIRVDDTDLAPLDRNHGADVVGIEHRLAGDNGDQAAGRYRVGCAIVDLQRDFRADESREREQAAWVPCIVQRLLVGPVAQLPA